MHRFVCLKAGLAAVLILVGAKMLLIDIWRVPIAWSLAAIASCLIVAVSACLNATRPTDQ